jgi:hypothetical protein
VLTSTKSFQSSLTELSKAAGKIMPRAAKIAREGMMMAVPVPSAKKIVTGAKVVKKVVKAVT